MLCSVATVTVRRNCVSLAVVSTKVLVTREVTVAIWTKLICEKLVVAIWVVLTLSVVSVSSICSGATTAFTTTGKSRKKDNGTECKCDFCFHTLMNARGGPPFSSMNTCPYALIGAYG